MEFQKASCASTSNYSGVWYSSSSCGLLHHSRDIPKQRNSRTHHLSDMVCVQLFRKAYENLPPLLQTQDPGEALRPTLLKLAEICTNFVHTFPEAARRLVCDYSNNNFGLHHVEALAQWLQQPTTDVTVYASDLSFNSIQCPLWKVLVPLVNKLLQHIQH